MGSVMATNQLDTARATFNEAVAGYIAKYRGLRGAAKILARLASAGSHSVSPHTTRAWLINRSDPSLMSIEIMAARCEELAAILEQERIAIRALVHKSPSSPRPQQ